MYDAKSKDTPMVRAFLTGIWISCWLLGVSALASDTFPSTYVGRSWQMQDGLPEQTVQAFAQTKDRYLWIGTTGGLLRFDGARMVLFDRDNTRHSPTTIFSI
jgi:ligand-binding sensor domain-containing protein